ncbi:phosphatidylethanolamine-binding protein 4 isoform X2 [Lethenteron reissneri]|uniref:phosphatidylethanolamine-binding protein 4 isoform X2 n=1 Tax=Lethenteron reissneri TaxID=7753 RepID=UPI002AB790C3|nr:phosphatidylethanolamine-binding protein 4 isoform X2 [Lethenteron reissneri]
MLVTAAVLLMSALCCTGQQINVNTFDPDCIDIFPQDEMHMCQGGLKVDYPEAGDVACSVITKCYNFRSLITNKWPAPSIVFPTATLDAKYVLVMVDPDAPSRTNPIWKYWRHWLVSNIKGSDLRNGNVKGSVLTDYNPPSPPSGSGFHRYMIFIFNEPVDQTISLTPSEKASRGKWMFEDFVERFKLGVPVASAEFITKNGNDS